MKSETKRKVSYVSHEDVHSAMDRYFSNGGKITKIDYSNQELLLKKDMGDLEMNDIDPHAANPGSNGLGSLGNILQQEVHFLQKEDGS